ncbi:hypothetical protein PACTADRAFT_51445, partial [Pachysolen tannophilus NRRL Y-2460]
MADPRDLPQGPSISSSSKSDLSAHAVNGLQDNASFISEHIQFNQLSSNNSSPPLRNIQRELTLNSATERSPLLQKVNTEGTGAVSASALGSSSGSPRFEDVETGNNYYSTDLPQVPRRQGSIVSYLSDVASENLSNPNLVHVEGPVSSPNTIIWLIQTCRELLITYPKASSLIVAIAMVIFVNLMYIWSNAELIFKQAINLDLENVSVLGISESGLNVHVSGSVQVDYSQVTSLYSRGIILILGALLGTVDLIPTQKVDLFVEIPNIEPLHRLVILDPPKVNVNLINKQITSFDFDNCLEVVHTNTIKIINILLGLKEEGVSSVDILVSGLFFFDLKSSIYNVNGNTFAFDEKRTIQLSPTNEDFSLIDSFDFNLYTSTEVLSSDIHLKTNYIDYAFTFNMDPLDWIILLPSCESWNNIETGIVETGEIIIRPMSQINLDTHIEITQLSSKLLNKCSFGKLSPINDLIKNFLEGNEIQNVYIIGSENQETNLPTWFDFIVKRLRFPINIKKDLLIGNSDSLFENYFDDYTLKILFLDLNKSILISSDIVLEFNLPDAIKGLKDINISNFRGELQMIKNDTAFGGFYFEDWQSSNLKIDDSMVVKMELMDVAFEIFDPITLSDVLGNFMRHVSSEIIIENILDLEVESSIGNSTFYELPASLNFKLDGSDIGGLLNNLNTNITDILLLDSSEKELKLFMDLIIENPLDISLDLHENSIELIFEHNGFTLGYVSTRDLPKILPKSSFNMSALLTFDPTSFNPNNHANAITSLENLLSSYLSGNETRLSFSGHEESIPSFEKLSKVLESLSLDFELPAYSIGPSSENKGFLISSTMHIMTSEIVFTVFNPVSNAEVVIEILKAQATFEGTTLGYLEKQEILYVPPGIYTTPRLPITYSDGIGADILRRALNGDLKVDGSAVFNFRLDNFELELMYSGHGLSTNI